MTEPESNHIQVLIQILRQLEKLNQNIEVLRRELKQEFDSLSSDVRSVL